MDYKIEPMSVSCIDAVIDFWHDEGVLLIDDLDTEDKLKAFTTYNQDYRSRELSLVAIAEGVVEGAVLCGHDGRTAYIRHLAARNNDYECQRRLLNHCITGLSRAARLECCYFLLSGDTKGERPGDDIESLVFLLNNGWRIRSDVAVMSYPVKNLPDTHAPLPEGYHIDPMHPDHHADILRLWKANEGALNVHPIMDSQLQMTRFLERNSYSAERNHSFVLKFTDPDRKQEPGKIVGSVQCGHDQRGAFLRKLAVDREHRQHRLGSHLLQASLESISRHTQVSRVYALIGLRNIRVAKFYYEHGWDMREDLLVFYKNLSRRGGD